VPWCLGGPWYSVNKVILCACQLDLAPLERWPGRVAVPHRLASRHPAWRDQAAEFASSLKKGARIHVAGYLRSREVVKKGAGRGKKSGTSPRPLAPGAENTPKPQSDYLSVFIPTVRSRRVTPAGARPAFLPSISWREPSQNPDVVADHLSQ